MPAGARGAAGIATLTKDIALGEFSNFWFNAVVRGDVAGIVIGRRAAAISSIT